MAFYSPKSGCRRRALHVITCVRPFAAMCSAITLSASLFGCGGGNQPDASTTTNGDVNRERLTAQSIAVSTANVTGPSWTVVPPAFTEPNTYTRSSNTGRTFYVDVVDGNNSYPGTSEQQPWKTLSRVAQESFANGDAILLRCGRVWRESLTLTGVNRPNVKNILIGAYGNNCTSNQRPVIRASKWINDQGWVPTEVGSAVRKLSVSGTVKRLFRNGLPLMQARYPNPQVNGNRFALADVTGTLTGSENETELNAKKKTGFKVRATELSQLQNKDLVGATVYVRTLPYVVETAKVQSFNGTSGEVTLDHALTFTIEKSAGYIFEGKQWMVDSDGEWAHDGNDPGLLYFQPVAGDPKGLEGLEASYQDYGLKVYLIDGLKIERVRFEQQEVAGIDAGEITNLVINDVESVYSFGHGVFAAQSPGVSITNTRVDGAGQYGIGAWESSGAIITDNYVTRSGLFRVGAPVGDNVSRSVGIRVKGGPNARIENNYVHNSASTGIFFENMPGVVVAHNTVLLPCQLLTDCGGIYTYGGTAFVPATATRGSVHHNIVAGLTSNLDGGFVYGLNNLVAGKNQAVGIYLDDHSSWVAITDNQIIGAEVGIYIHNGANNLIQSNTVRASTYASLLGVFDAKQPETDQMQGNDVRDNTFFSHRRVNTARFADAAITDINGDLTYAQLWMHRDDPSAFFASTGSGPRNRSENNHTYTLSKVETPSVWRSVSSGKLEQASGAIWGLKGLTTPYQTLGLSQWTAMTQPPVNAQDTESSPVAFKAFKFTGQASLISNGAFINGQGGWVSNGGEFEYWSGVMCGGPATCGRTKPTEAWNILASNAFSVTAQNLYRAQFTVAAGQTGGAHNAQIRLNASPWSSVALSVPTSTWSANEVRRIEHFFRATTTASNIVLSLRPSDGSNMSNPGNMFFGQASLSSAAVETQALPPLSTLGMTLVNSSSASKSFGCVPLGFSSADCTNGRVVDELNQPVPFPLDVPAGGGKQLYVRLVEWVQ